MTDMLETMKAKAALAAQAWEIVFSGRSRDERWRLCAILQSRIAGLSPEQTEQLREFFHEVDIYEDGIFEKCYGPQREPSPDDTSIPPGLL